MAIQTNEEIVDDLKAIFQKFMEEDFFGRRKWTGAEHGKASIGNSILGAIRHYDPDFQIPNTTDDAQTES